MIDVDKGIKGLTKEQKYSIGFLVMIPVVIICLIPWQLTAAFAALFALVALVFGIVHALKVLFG